MSICRFGADSDVYVFEDCTGGITCCGCALDEHFNCETESEMADHLVKHQEAGHLVPADVIASLRGEREVW